MTTLRSRPLSPEEARAKARAKVSEIWHSNNPARPEPYDRQGWANRLSDPCHDCLKEAFALVQALSIIDGKVLPPDPAQTVMVLAAAPDELYQEYGTDIDLAHWAVATWAALEGKIRPEDERRLSVAPSTRVTEQQISQRIHDATAAVRQSEQAAVGERTKAEAALKELEETLQRTKAYALAEGALSAAKESELDALRRTLRQRQHELQECQQEGTKNQWELESFRRTRVEIERQAQADKEAVASALQRESVALEERDKAREQLKTSQRAIDEARRAREGAEASAASSRRRYGLLTVLVASVSILVTAGFFSRKQAEAGTSASSLDTVCPEVKSCSEKVDAPPVGTAAAGQPAAIGATAAVADAGCPLPNCDARSCATVCPTSSGTDRPRGASGGPRPPATTVPSGTTPSQPTTPGPGVRAQSNYIPPTKTLEPEPQ